MDGLPGEIWYLMVKYGWLTLENYYALCFASQAIACSVGTDPYVMKFAKELRNTTTAYSITDAYKSGNQQMLWFKLHAIEESPERTQRLNEVLVMACEDDNTDVVTLCLHLGAKVERSYQSHPIGVCIASQSFNALGCLMRYCENEKHLRYNLRHDDSACTLLCEKPDFD